MSDFLSPAINDVLKGDNMDFDERLDKALREYSFQTINDFARAFEDGKERKLDTDKKYKEHIKRIFLDTIEKAKPEEKTGNSNSEDAYNYALNEYQDRLVKEIKK